MSLWAAVPHYVSLAPSPRAARALCDRLSGVLGTEIDVRELADAEDAYVEQVSEAAAGDAETAAYVEELEQRADSLDLLEESGGLPSGEALAARSPCASASRTAARRRRARAERAYAASSAAAGRRRSGPSAEGFASPPPAASRRGCPGWG